MTEHELKALKSVLDSSEQALNSTELDDEILRAAYAKAERMNVDKTWFERVVGLLSLRSSSLSVGSAVLSLFLTVAVFFGLSNLISVEPGIPPQVAQNADTATEIYIDSNKLQLIEPAIRFAKPEYSVQTPPSSINARDQLLAAMTLPSADTVVDRMMFNQEADRVLAGNLVAQAMSDIQVLIRDGEFNQARSRFDQLRQRCSVCTLPESLELLVAYDAREFSSG